MKMLVCHTERGQIENIIFEPFPAGTFEQYDALGIRYVVIDSELSGHVLAREFYVSDGEAVRRPEFDACDVAIVADGVDSAIEATGSLSCAR
jgi:hypothetical protein